MRMRLRLSVAASLALALAALASACADTPKDAGRASRVRVRAASVATTHLRDVVEWTITLQSAPFRAVIVGLDDDGRAVLKARLERTKAADYRYGITAPAECVIRTTRDLRLETLYRSTHDDPCADVFHDVATHFRALSISRTASASRARSTRVLPKAVAPLASSTGVGGEDGDAFSCIKSLVQGLDPKGTESFEDRAMTDGACADVFEASEDAGAATKGYKLKYKAKKSATKAGADGGRVACDDKNLCLTLPSEKASPVLLGDCDKAAGAGQGYAPTNIAFQWATFLMGIVGEGVGELVCIAEQTAFEVAAGAADGGGADGGADGQVGKISLLDCDLSAGGAVGARTGTFWYKEAPLEAADRQPNASDEPDPVIVVNRADGRCLVADSYRGESELKVIECADEESVKRWVFEPLGGAQGSSK